MLHQCWNAALCESSRAASPFSLLARSDDSSRSPAVIKQIVCFQFTLPWLLVVSIQVYSILEVIKFFVQFYCLSLHQNDFISKLPVTLVQLLAVAFTDVY